MYYHFITEVLVLYLDGRCWFIAGISITPTPLVATVKILRPEYLCDKGLITQFLPGVDVV